MTERVAFMLAFVKNMLPAVCEVIGLAVAFIFGLLYATQSQAQTQAEDAAAKLPAFEVASIKPDKSGTPMIMFRLTPDGLNVTKPSSLDGCPIQNQRLWLMVIDHVQKPSEG